VACSVAVDSLVSRATMLLELEAVRVFAERYGWGITVAEEAPHFRAHMRAHNGDRYVLDVDCGNYREQPPYFEFLDPETGEPGTAKAYPASKVDSFFHSNRCICAPFNRKAYTSIHPQGPHGDWVLGEWSTSRANNYDWSNASTLGDMLMMIQARLMRPDFYGGRMG
jgi:hypothetical protein